MKPVNRPDVPPLHAIAALAMRIVVTVVVLGCGLLIAAYFALGRPDAFFSEGAFPQLVSGARDLAAGVPAQDSALLPVLRVAGVALVVGLVVLIGAIGIWDAWQSRRHGSAQAPPAGAGRTGRGPLEPAAGSLRPGAITRMRVQAPERAPTDPDTLQGGTA